MTSFKKILAFAAAGLLASAMGASAAPILTAIGGSVFTYNDGGPSNGNILTYGATGSSANSGTGTAGTASNGLMLSEAGLLTFTRIFTSASDTDDIGIYTGSDVLFSNKSNIASATRLLGAGFVDFAFYNRTDGGNPFGNNPNYLARNFGPIGSFVQLGLRRVSDTSWLAFFDDGGGSTSSCPTSYKTGDCDFNDLIVRIDVAAIPLPAAVWLLLAGIGGLGVVARRKAVARA